mgnify:CR=1 FL=1
MDALIFPAVHPWFLQRIGAGYVGQHTGSMWAAFATAIALGVVLSMGTAIVYIVGRLPIIICTIGMTLLYESLTYLLFGGQGIRGFYSTPALSQMGRMPLVLLPAVLAMILFVVYTYFTASGRRGKILANNQSAGVNIGINENKNVFVSYIFSGLDSIGLSSKFVYILQNDVTPQSGLATSSIMFSYIVPVFMGTLSDWQAMM